MTGEQLGVQLYGDEANPITLRAEMARLRRLLGDELLASRPYRLRIPVRADFVELAQLLERRRGGRGRAAPAPAGGQVHEPVAVGGGEGAAGAGDVPVGGGDEVQQGSGHTTSAAGRTALRSCSAGCC